MIKHAQHVVTDTQDLGRSARVWRRIGGLATLAGILAVGCVAPVESASGEDEAIAEAHDHLYGNHTYWPKSADGFTIIPVCWKFDGYDGDKLAVRNAVEAGWAAKSSIKLTNWGRCTAADNTAKVIRISQSDSTPHTDRVGPGTYGVNMVLNFTYSNWNSYTRVSCDCPEFDIECVFHSRNYYQYSCDWCDQNHDYCDALIGLHEFGHALGFEHEQTRPENADGALCDEWQDGEGTEYGGDELTSGYDGSSIMGYCSQWDRSSATLSSGDIDGVIAAYGHKPNPLTHQVLIYRDHYFTGLSQALFPGDYNVGNIRIGNDELTSLRIPSGFSVTLYRNSNFGGESVVLTGDVTDLGAIGWNDAASSIRVQGPEDIWPILYKDGNFSGAAQLARPGLHDVGDLSIGNDAMSSMRIPSGWTVTLYQDAQFGGARNSYSGDWASFSTWNDRASSVRVQGPPDRSPVVIFDDTDRFGPAQALWPGRYNEGDLTIGNDRLSSLVVPAGWTVTLFEDEDFGGDRMIYTASSDYVGSFNDKTSSIVVEGP